MRRKGNFPSQIVSDKEKLSKEYGLKVARAIESEWFDDSGYNNSRYLTDNNNFHKLRLYARGEQSIQKYKDELSINGDLSYLNLDWKPVPIIPKFVDIVVNGMTERLFKVNAYSQDPFGVEKRTKYMESIQKDMDTAEFNDMAQNLMNMDLYENKKEDLPENEDELALHMQLNYKQAVEIAEEQAINTLLEGNKYNLTKKRLYYDLTVLGIAAVKTSFNKSEGVVIDYVDPANLVYSYTDSPYFEDIYYVGEIKEIPINELVKQFPDLTNEDLEDIDKNNFKGAARSVRQRFSNDDNDKNKISILYFNYKTFVNEVYKMKETGTGGDKAIEKDDSFNPPENKEGDFSKLDRKVECLYEGALILGTDKLLKWEKARNMMRTKSDFTKVKMNYNIVAPRMYNGRIESIVSRVTGFADMIQLTHLKLQQVMSRITPDGIYLDADGLAEIDLGNGTNYNPQEALNMFFQTGSIIGRSFTADGDQNPGKMPIQEIQSGGGQKMQSLIGTYNYYLQMIRDVTGLNEASDGSMPAERSLVGIQKIAAANSNTATRHILNSGLFLTADVAEQLSLRISDIIEYSPTKEAFIESIGAHNVATLEEMSELHLYDFGIFLELEPDEEEKQLLENNIQTALSQQSIELEDAIDLRAIKNIKLSNQLLKLRRKRKGEIDQQNTLEQTRAQGDAQAKAAQAQVDAERQKQEAIMETQLQLEDAKIMGKQKILDQEGNIKERLMQLEFQYEMQLKQLEAQTKSATQLLVENRKDDRTKMQATQQSAMIDQKENQKPSQDFQNPSGGLGGFDLGM